MSLFVRAWAFIIVLIIAISAVASPFVAYGTKRTVTAEVTRTERVCTGGAQVSCRYLVFTDGTTYENTDSLFFLKFNSSDIYGHIKTGHTYRLTISGFRVPLASMYPNIVSLEEVK